MKKMMFSLAFLSLLFVGCGTADIHDNNVTIINQDSFNNNEAVVDAGKTDAEVNEATVDKTAEKVDESDKTIREIHNVVVSNLATTGFTVSWDGGSNDCVIFLKSFDKDYFTVERPGNNTYTYTQLSEGSSWVVYVKDNVTGKIIMYPSVVKTKTADVSYPEISNVSVSDITKKGFTITWDGGSGNTVVYLKSHTEGYITKEILAVNSYTYTQLPEGSAWEVFVKDNDSGKVLEYGAIVTTNVSSNSNNSALIKVYGGGEYTVEEINALQREYLKKLTHDGLDFVVKNHYRTIEKYGNLFFNEMINYKIHKILGDDSYEFHIDHFLNERGGVESYASSAILNFSRDDLFLDVSFVTLDTGSAPGPIPVVKVKLNDIYRVESIYRLYYHTSNTKTYYRSVTTGVPAGTRKIAYIYTFDGSNLRGYPVAIAYNSL